MQSDMLAYVRETDSACILPYGLKIEWVKEDDVEVCVDKRRRGEVVAVMQYPQKRQLAESRIGDSWLCL